MIYVVLVVLGVFLFLCFKEVYRLIAPKFQAKRPELTKEYLEQEEFLRTHPDLGKRWDTE